MDETLNLKPLVPLKGNPAKQATVTATTPDGTKVTGTVVPPAQDVTSRTVNTGIQSGTAAAVVYAVVVYGLGWPTGVALAIAAALTPILTYLHHTLFRGRP